jgi:hypothetical protein
MAYFQSLQGWRESADMIQQHQQDIEQEANDAKARTFQEKSDYLDKQLETAGGAVGGFGGAYHIGRKIYKKIKTVQQKAKEVKQKMSGDKGEPSNDNNADSDDKQPSGDKDNSGKANGTEDDADTSAPSNNTGSKAKVQDDNSANDTDASNANKSSGDSTGGSDSTGQPKSSDVSSQGQNAPKNSAPDNTVSADADPVQGPLKAEDTEVAFPDAASHQELLDERANADLQPSAPDPVQQAPSTTTQPPTSGSANAQPDSVQAGSGDGPINTVDDPVLNQMGQRTPYQQGAGTSDRAAYNMKDAQNGGSGSQASSGDATGDLANKGGDLADQTASSVSKTTDAADGVMSKGGDVLNAAKTAGSDAIEEGVSAATSGVSDALSVAGGVLDFLGPVGELVGAGLALGSFFHDLFGHKKTQEKQEQAEAAPTNIAGASGLDTSSLSSQNVKTNVVGSIV